MPGFNAGALASRRGVMCNFDDFDFDRFGHDIRKAAREFARNMRDWSKEWSEDWEAGGCGGPDFGRPGHGPDFSRMWHGPDRQDHPDRPDYAPPYYYPRMNVYLNPERALVFEFFMAGFEEKDINLSFKDDFMILSAKVNPETEPQEGNKYFKKAYVPRDVDRQKYFVPADRFDQEKVKAVFKGGILKVTVPSKEGADVPEGVKIEIVKEGD
jgi:HSP20 family protein